MKNLTWRILLVFVGSFISIFLVGKVFAADGSGTASVSVSPGTTLVNSAGNTLTFTYTAAESMNSGGITITIPSGWSTPQGVAGTAGYTTVSTTGTVGNEFDNADSVTGWTGNACSGGLTLDTTLKHAGTGSISCINNNEQTHDVWYKTVGTGMDWSGYTTVGFWIYSDTAFTNNQLQFEYSTGSDLSAPVEALGFGTSIAANTWTYVSFNFGSASSARTAIKTYGFQIANSSVKSSTVHIDDFSVGAGTSFVPNFSGNDIVVTAISLTNGQTITVTYGANGGSSGAVAPGTPQTSSFVVKSKTIDSGTLTALASSPTVSVIDTTAPTVSLTNPTTGSTIHGSSVALSATASDNVSVAGIRFYFDGSLLGTEIGGSSPYSSTFDSTAKIDGSHTIIAVARDTSNNYATSTAATVTIDNTPPVISSIASSSASATTGTVTWATNENSTSKVSYGTSSGNYTLSTSSVSLSTSHSLTLTSLSEATNYYYVVVSADASGNTSTSSEKTLLTADATAPSVTLTSPSTGAHVSGTISLAATASDNVAVAGVRFYVDGSLVGSEDTSVPYTGSLNTTTLSDGTHSVVAVARDTSNNYATSTAATITSDNNPPSLTSVGIASNNSNSSYATTGNVVTLTFTASEAVRTPTVTIDGHSASVATTTGNTFAATYTLTSGDTEGSVSFTISVVDLLGNVITNTVTTTTNSSSVTFDKTAPVISGIASSTSATAATVTWTTSENATSAVWYGTFSGNYTLSTSSASLVTSHSIFVTGLTKSTKYYYAVVSNDAAGNPATSTEKSFTTTSSDTMPPLVSLTAPSNGSTVAGSSVVLSANATDDTAVAGVKFYVDGSLVDSEDTTSPYAVTFDSTAKSDGSHTIVAVARDTSNNYATSTSATVTIDNTPPVVSGISSNPNANGATITWTTNEAASSQISFGLTSAYGTLSPESDTSVRVTSHSVSLSGLVSCATYHFTASSTDAVGNSGIDGDNTFTTKGCAGNASVKSQNSHSIVHGTGGIASLSTSDAVVSLTVPASYGTSDAQFQIKELDKDAALGAIGAPTVNTTAAGQVFDFHALTATDTAQTLFSTPLTITLSYTAADVTNLDENSLMIYRNDSGVWTQLTSCSVDKIAKTVTCNTDHFSTFAIFGQTVAQVSPSPATNSGIGGGVVGCTDKTARNYSLYALGTDKTTCVYNNIVKVQSSISASTTAPYQFTRQLKEGMTGNDVHQLQLFLVTKGFLNSKNYTDSYFGPRTITALNKFQQAHAAEILKPQGLTKPTGRFGLMTIKTVNAMLIQNK